MTIAKGDSPRPQIVESDPSLRFSTRTTDVSQGRQSLKAGSHEVANEAIKQVVLVVWPPRPHVDRIALRSGRLRLPLSAIALRRFIPHRAADSVACELQARADTGYTMSQLADLAEMIVLDRIEHSRSRDSLDLVWTGPEAGGIANRDTGVVVRELFHTASKSVMIAGYAVSQGHLIFEVLAQRMDEFPELHVRMYLDVRRPEGNFTSQAQIVRRFAARFKEKNWRGSRLPEIYYDPRSSELDPSRRASLHAKCIVVDEALAFVSSANFTQAAQRKNIEVGVLIRSKSFAVTLSSHFQMLSAAGLLLPIPLG
jgi:hypothetical protein